MRRRKQKNRPYSRLRIQKQTHLPTPSLPAVNCPQSKDHSTRLPAHSSPSHHSLRTRVPRTSIAHRAAPRARTRPAKLLGQILGRDLRQQLILVARIQDINLRHRHLIQPRLDHAPDGGERPGRVDDIKLAHTFRVPVLADRGRRHDVVLDAIEIRHGDPLQVKDRAGGFDRVADQTGGGRQTLR
jgi:hypothetical protein